MKKKINIFKFGIFVLFFLLAFFSTIINFYAFSLDKTIDDEKSVVDTSTLNTYENIINENNIGKVWTDKSVFNDDINLNNNVIKKEDDEDFLVSLSALALGIDLNIKEGNVKDIVILQDTSESMIENNVKSGNTTITRLQASKNAINKLLQIITNVNKTLSNDDEKFNVSLITFCSSDTQKIIFDLTEVNSDNLATLQSKVNGMTVKSGTYVDPGIKKVQQELQNHGRKNVDSCLITFLDGEAEDANAAIATANKLKNEEGIVIYSIIVNASAKGGTSTTLDKIGQGLSSNFDKATSANNLGTRTGNTYYYIPNTADELISSFEDVIKSIVRKPYTFRKGSRLVFTDKLGKYMEVNKIKGLYYDGELYTQVEEKKDNNINTYIFKNSVNDVFGNPTNTNEIEISVIKSEEISIGDTITVSLPYNLVPLSVYDVLSTFLTDSTVYTTTLEEKEPISIIYSSNVKKSIFDLFRKSDSNLKDYINKNGSINNYEADTLFYSNLYEKGNEGSTEVVYSPHNKNSYYYYEDDSFLYTKDDNNYSLYTGENLPFGQYYIKKIVYTLGDKKEQVETYEIAEESSQAVKDENNNWYIKEGTIKQNINNTLKEKNETKTATNLNLTSFEGQEVKTLLGNNGIVEVYLDVDRINIKINKVWKDFDKKGRPESITIKLKRNNEILDDYDIELNEENNWTYTYENLPLTIDGEQVTYAIEEEKIDNYETKIEGNQEIGFTITNTFIEVENPNTGFKTVLTITGLSLMIIFTYRYLNKHKYTMYKL